MSQPPTSQDPWSRLRSITHSRIGLARAGDASTTSDQLAFQLAHAKARDAVHDILDLQVLASEIRPIEAIFVASAARDRAEYLRRPDLGRQLNEQSRRILNAVAGTGGHVTFVVADGLSSPAVRAHAKAVLQACHGALSHLSRGPVVLASNGRVALGDEIGLLLGAQVIVMLIGERPGLSTPDSLGIYVTYDPRPGRKDSERNCISNIHAHGLSYHEAARQVRQLVDRARALGGTGVELGL